MIIIRNAEEKDINQIIVLLKEVLELHAKIRPDIFISGTTKYNYDDLKNILNDDKRHSYVAADENDNILGYALCVLKEQPFSNNMVQFKSMYIDDLCVDEKTRGQNIGTLLFEYVKKEAIKLGCYEITLNVWEGNNAKAFYSKMGMVPKSTTMELILK